MTSQAPKAPLRLTVLMPVFQDFAAANLVCRAVDAELSRVADVEARILLVDDGTLGGQAAWSPFTPQSLRGIDILELRRNLGHQRAIAVGLCHLHDRAACDAVL